MTCKDVMTASPKCCLPDDTVARAAMIMREEDVGPVPVVSDLNSKRLIGILTDRDIAVKVVAAGRDPKLTRVDQIMSKDLVTCRVNEGYEQALNAMAQHQVRRIPVLDEQGRLCGIIAQADVARETTEEEVGQVVEEISEPAGLGRSIRSAMPGSYVTTPARSGSGAASLLVGAAFCGIGAGLMYLLDPDRGRSRRANVGSKTSALYKGATDYSGKVQRDLRNRVTGIMAGAKAMKETESEVSDQKLESRVRTKLGRVASYPNAISVRADQGKVTLEGPVLARESSGIQLAVHSVPGVKEVENRLQVHESAENIPELQGESQRSRQRWEFMQSNWSPAARFLAGTLGSGLAIYGMKGHGPLAKATAGVGVGLLARGISNKDMKTWADVGAARRVLGR